MVTINEITKNKQCFYNCVRGIVYSDENYLEFGYFEPEGKMPRTEYKGTNYRDIRQSPDVMELFSVNFGKYVRIDKNSPEYEEHKNVFGNGSFPYSIERNYGAEKHIMSLKKL